MIAIGGDHSALELKAEIMAHLNKRGEVFDDFVTHTRESCDYPDIAKAVCGAILEGRCDRGILICGTGIGISIAANRFRGIRAALCSDCFSAQATREHNDANVLVMGARVIGPGLACQITDTWLDTPFSEEDRHINRLKKLEANVSE